MEGKEGVFSESRFVGRVSKLDFSESRCESRPNFLTTYGGLKMQLEDYFDFLSDDDIRIKGTRIGIESVLYEYIHRAQEPEAIAQRYRTLSLEQIYATILYYLQNKEKVGGYLADYLEYCREAREEYEKKPPSVVARLRQLKAERKSAGEKMLGLSLHRVNRVEQPCSRDKQPEKHAATSRRLSIGRRTCAGYFHH